MPWTYQTRYFYKLHLITNIAQTAENNEERRRTYNELSEMQMTWIGLTRIAMGRALTDARAYHLDADRATLLPSKKKRPCTSDVSTNLNVIEKTDADIAVTDANDIH